VEAHELDDTVQEVFLRAWQARSTFRQDANPSTWLTRIAVNYLISRRRSIRSRMAALRWFATGGPSAHAHSDVSAESREAHARAISCVRRLSPKLRAVFVLRYLEEMSSPEVAQALGITESTVRTRAFHARKRLRKMMRGYEP
jgi:RNA polymerase sigma-70 factor (ECF subfamily)